MAVIKISEAAAAAAQSSIDSLAGGLEAAAKFPELTYREAPMANAAAADVGRAWQSRLRAEVSGLESVGFAFTVVAETFVEGDASLSDTLADLEMARVNAGHDR